MSEGDYGDQLPPKVNFKYKLRGGTGATWLAVDPVLGLSEPGHETDTGRMKLGDGVSKWSQLPYVSAEGNTGDPSLGDLYTHINSPNPHPVLFDLEDGPDLTLLYQNAKV